MNSKKTNDVLLHQTLAMIPVLLVEFMTGVGNGWLAPMLHQLKESPETAFTSENCSWIASLQYASRGIMSIVAIFMIDRLGRKMFFVIAAFICFIMWVVVYWSLNVYVHYAVRILFGVSVGLHDMAAGIYIGENCSPRVRGIFSGFYSASFYFGGLLQFVLAAFVSYQWLAIINGAIGFFTLLTTYFLVEPAHYLILKGNVKKAEKNYQWLYDPQDPQTKRDLEDIKNYVLGERGRNFNCETLRSREVYKSLRIVSLMHFLCFINGFVAINSFVTILFSGSTGLSNTQLTISFGLVLFLAIMTSAPFLDKYNRRTFFLCTTAVIVILHAATAALYYASTMYEEVPHFYWILFILLTTYMSVHGIFIFPITMVVRGEVLPQNMKGFGSTLAGISGSVGGFIGAKIFLPISDSFGNHTNFILLSLFSIVMFLYIYFDLPETKGKTLIEIQRELKGNEHTQKTLT